MLIIINDISINTLIFSMYTWIRYTQLVYNGLVFFFFLLKKCLEYL